jgi:hypothetical protein
LGLGVAEDFETAEVAEVDGGVFERADGGCFGVEGFGFVGSETDAV